MKKLEKLEIEELIKVFDCYDGEKFSNKKFAMLLLRKRALLKDGRQTEKGRLKTDDRTIYRFADLNPAIQQYRSSKFIIESRKLKGLFRLVKMGVLELASIMFGQITGRTNVSQQPVNPFGAPRRMRTMIGAD